MHKSKRSALSKRDTGVKIEEVPHWLLQISALFGNVEFAACGSVWFASKLVKFVLFCFCVCASVCLALQ